jgi:hypothetical protein
MLYSRSPRNGALVLIIFAILSAALFSLSWNLSTQSENHRYDAAGNEPMPVRTPDPLPITSAPSPTSTPLTIASASPEPVKAPRPAEITPKSTPPVPSPVDEQPVASEVNTFGLIPALIFFGVLLILLAAVVQNWLRDDYPTQRQNVLGQGMAS